MQSTDLDDSNVINETCTICLLKIFLPICTLECSHSYCLECIKEWCKSHNTCPLCSKEISLAETVEKDGTTNNIVLECTKPEKMLSLDCLDHSYFKQEIAKLLRLCYELEVSRFKQRNAKGTPEEWRALKGIRSRLEMLRLENENFVRFEPEVLLDEVYQINSDIDMIKIGNLPSYDYNDKEEYYYDENSYEEYDD